LFAVIKYFCLFLITQLCCSSLSDKVHQTPADMYKNKDKNETAEIICSHSIDSYNRILWYKQSDDGQLRYLGYMYGKTATPETGAGVKMNGDANKGKNCTLTTEALELKDSAVYFCAAIVECHRCKG
uniref:Immunoglobulin V-set domain-containing protein n=1 Tax=Cynoglossus semilaevis TaxID=244447 RepID=A0A3P8VR17_CYNSE